MMRRRFSASDTADRAEALTTRFRAQEFTETVYRASLYALGLRGAEIDEIVKPELELKWQKTRSPSRRPS